MSTIRTIKLKRASFDSESAPAADAVPGSEPVLAQVSAAPAPALVVAKGASSKTYMPYMIFAVLVVIAFAVIMGLQYAEFSFYEAPPSVWVKK
jgi:hypothetical protein